MAAMTSSKQHFQNLYKISYQIFETIMWSKIHQNRQNSVQIKAVTDRQTHRQTHRQGAFRTKNILSFEMTEFKNRNTKGQ